MGASIINARGIQFRLIMAGILIATVPLVIASLITWHHMHQIKRQISNSVLSLSSADYTHLAESLYESSGGESFTIRGFKKSADHDRRGFAANSPLTVRPREKVAWTVVDSAIRRTKIISLPKVYMRNVWLKQIYDPPTPVLIVDDSYRSVENLSMIFQRMNEQCAMLRIATCLG